MPKTRPPYPAEFRQQIVELAQAGRTPGELAREFGPSEQTLYNGLAQAVRQPSKPLRGENGLTDAEREERIRLPRECRQSKRERDLLAKPTAWFAAKSDAGSQNPSRSCGESGRLSRSHLVPRAEGFGVRAGAKLVRI